MLKNPPINPVKLAEHSPAVNFHGHFTIVITPECVTKRSERSHMQPRAMTILAQRRGAAENEETED
ncbi:MAG: hypothetical protein DMG05_23445 [Acidobacteria bacterium]|nr:MAG: hypothetical protein DMG05_23445 [Acidobacteriota bacterium]